jgi:hypothetical protein
MIRIHRIAAGLVAAVAGTIGLLAASPAAFAETVAAPSGGPAGPLQTVMVGGMPGWQTALIAVGAALIASVAAVLVDRARSARRLLAPAS